MKTQGMVLHLRSSKVLEESFRDISPNIHHQYQHFLSRHSPFEQQNIRAENLKLTCKLLLLRLPSSPRVILNRRLRALQRRRAAEKEEKKEEEKKKSVVSSVDLHL